MMKNFENFKQEIDPYGEEDWNDDENLEIGDIVISLENYDNKLTKGKEYIIIDFFRMDNNYIGVITDISDIFFLNKNRFKLKK
jgi:hypothetical protein